MTALSQEITGPAFWEGTIAEMAPTEAGADTSDLVVPSDFMQLVRANDPNPLFVTVEIESGWSRSKRNWKPEHLQKIVRMVNDKRMAGNLGHPLLDPKKWEADFPIPQVAWVVANTKDVGGRALARVKGYVLKRAEARELLELGLIDGVSVFGDSRMRPVSGGYEIVSFEPETIDFARKGKSGMPSRVVALTGEQETKEVNRVEPRDIAALSVDEIKTHAPLVHKAIQDEATEPLSKRIGEMDTAATAVQPDIELLDGIKKLLKLSDGENPLEKLQSLLDKIEDTAKADIKAFVNELVSKKVKTERGQALLRRFIGEMESEYDGPLTDDLKKKITDDFTSRVDDDDDIKELIGEMFVVPKNDDKDRGTTGGSSLGGRSRTGESHGRNEDGERRGGLKITKKKFADVS